MNIHLLVGVMLNRKEFVMPNFIPSNDMLILVKSGTFSVEVNGQTHTVKENEAFLFKKGSFHKRKILKECVLYVFRFDSDVDVFKDTHIIFHDIERIKSTLNLLKRIDRSVNNNNFSLKQNLLLDIIGQYLLENEFYTQSQIKDEKIESALNYISRSLHFKINLKCAAKLTNLSYVQFLRRFQKYTGVTPSEYITSLRMQKAKTLLSDTDYHIKDIAEKCGFESEYYFSNFFKKNAGLSPKAFRNSLKT